MFYPQEMTEIEIIVPERDALAVTRELADQGVFHQLDASYLSSEAGTNSMDVWQAQSAAYTVLERRLVSMLYVFHAGHYAHRQRRTAADEPGAYPRSCW